tara:strand:- start:656 stop:1039 length:384 start_codon:yes stop_codon:yes gene_type:complete
MSRQANQEQVNVSSQFEEGIKRWNTIDSEIATLNLKIRKLRERKQKEEETLIPYLQEKNLTKVAINLDDSRILCRQEKVYSSLSYKFLHECLTKLFNEDRADELCEKIKDMRTVKVATVLKRRALNK